VGQRPMALNLLEPMFALSNNRIGNLYGDKNSSVKWVSSSELLMGRSADIIILTDIRNSYEAHDAVVALNPNGNIIIVDSTIPLGFPFATLFLEKL
jgi:hypothetical protein